MKTGILMAVVCLTLGAALVVTGCSKQEESRTEHQEMQMESQETETSAQAKDLVCGMTVSTGTPNMATHEGKSYYFCSAGCKERFVDNPQKYISQ